jgi:hypothetical protein
VRALFTLSLVLATCASACESLIAEPTPVPGAAATLTRSINTPIPTPVRAPSPPPGSPTPSRAPAAVASPSPAPSGRGLSDADIAAVQQSIDKSLADPGLPGIEQLLLDRVSLSTSEGGQVLERAAAATWLRDHAGPGIHITRIDRSALSVLLEVQTEGWPAKSPINQGRVTFNLHRYDQGGNQDEDNGTWKIDVIGAE